jgi:hypothetical protein
MAFPRLLCEKKHHRTRSLGLWRASRHLRLHSSTPLQFYDPTTAQAHEYPIADLHLNGLLDCTTPRSHKCKPPRLTAPELHSSQYQDSASPQCNHDSRFWILQDSVTPRLLQAYGLVSLRPHHSRLLQLLCYTTIYDCTTARP